MGIQNLTKLIHENVPGAIKEADIKTYFGRKVAIDASMSLYQFLIAVRGQDGGQLTDEEGNTTRQGNTTLLPPNLCSRDWLLF